MHSSQALLLKDRARAIGGPALTAGDVYVCSPSLRLFALLPLQLRESPPQPQAFALPLPAPVRVVLATLHSAYTFAAHAFLCTDQGEEPSRVVVHTSAVGAA